MGADGAKVKGCYRFIYVFEDMVSGRFPHHHTSVMPKGIPTTGPTISKERVRNLFDLWNNALATLDSDPVAKRYSKDAVLLPTVSDTPRTDYALIKDNFDNFLKKKPQGVITAGNIICGEGWAQDAGVSVSVRVHHG
jgi:hypothetical protein